MLQFKEFAMNLLVFLKELPGIIADSIYEELYVYKKPKGVMTSESLRTGVGRAEEVVRKIEEISAEFAKEFRDV